MEGNEEWADMTSPYMAILDPGDMTPTAAIGKLMKRSSNLLLLLKVAGARRFERYFERGSHQPERLCAIVASTTQSSSTCGE